jgi:hypothetical protein
MIKGLTRVVEGGEVVAKVWGFDCAMGENLKRDLKNLDEKVASTDEEHNCYV